MKTKTKIKKKPSYAVKSEIFIQRPTPTPIPPPPNLPYKVIYWETFEYHAADENWYTMSRDLAEIPISKLVNISYNPPGRTENTGSLLSSISATGGVVLNHPHLLSPNVDGYFTIIDGHRRAQASRERGSNSMKCYVYRGANPDIIQELFPVLNGSVKPHTPADRLCALLRGCKAVYRNKNSKGDKAAYETVKTYVGKEVIDDLVAKKVSPHAVNLARRVVKCAYGDTTVENLRKHFESVLCWMLEHKQQLVAGHVLTNDRCRAAQAFRSAIDDNKKLKLKLSSDEKSVIVSLSAVQ